MFSSREVQLLPNAWRLDTLVAYFNAWYVDGLEVTHADDSYGFTAAFT